MTAPNTQHIITNAMFWCVQFCVCVCLCVKYWETEEMFDFSKLQLYQMVTSWTNDFHSNDWWILSLS